MALCVSALSGSHCCVFLSNWTPVYLTLYHLSTADPFVSIIYNKLAHWPGDHLHQGSSLHGLFSLVHILTSLLFSSPLGDIRWSWRHQVALKYLHHVLLDTVCCFHLSWGLKLFRLFPQCLWGLERCSRKLQQIFTYLVLRNCRIIIIIF